MPPPELTVAVCIPPGAAPEVPAMENKKHRMSPACLVVHIAFASCGIRPYG